MRGNNNYGYFLNKFKHLSWLREFWEEKLCFPWFCPVIED